VLSERGLRKRPQANRPAGPISAKYLAPVLRDRYYLGTVSYNGEEYQGRHERLSVLLYSRSTRPDDACESPYRYLID
jgi:hypothetical protein